MGLLAHAEGELDRAAVLTSDALVGLRRYGQRNMVIAALSACAWIDIDRGRLEAAHGCIAEALEVGLRRARGGSLIFQTEAAAALVMQRDRPRDAVILFALGHELHERYSGAYWSKQHERDIHERIAELRATLGDEAFDELWNRGRGFDVERVSELL